MSAVGYLISRIFRFQGAGLMWDDFDFPAASGKVAGALIPAEIAWRKNAGGTSDGVFGRNMVGNLEKMVVHYPKQIKHGFRPGEHRWHMHLILLDAIAHPGDEGDEIDVEAEFTVASVDGIFPVTTTYSGKYVIGADDEQFRHIVITLDTFDGSSLGPSALVACTSRRLGNTDSYAGDVIYGGVDAHIQRWSHGTDNEFSWSWAAVLFALGGLGLAGLALAGCFG